MNDKLIEIYESAATLLKAQSLNGTYKTIVAEAAKLAGAMSGTIYLAQKSDLKRVYTSIPRDFRIQPRKGGYTYVCYNEKRALFIEADFVRNIHPEWKEHRAGSVVMLPLTYDSKCIGVLTLHSNRPNEMTATEKKTMEVFASLASLKIRNTQLYADIKRTLELRDMFISTATHELNTPLTVLLGYIQRIQRKNNKDAVVKSEWISILEEQVKRLQRIINGILKVNQIKTFELKLLNIRDPLNKALLYIRQSYPDHKIIVSDKLDTFKAQVKVDSGKFSQAIINIIENSAKFSPAGSEILINIDYDNDNVYLFIEDKGAGIDKKDISKVFEGFYKGSNTREGFGMGLYMAKLILEAHNGTIDVKSKKNVGTTMILSLPIVRKK
jgi:K+-sensing histidine kinase KdpD